MINKDYREELYKKGLKIIKNQFDNELEISTLYFLQEDGNDYIVVSQKDTKLCVMFDTTHLEMVGLQPIDYVKEWGEKL